MKNCMNEESPLSMEERMKLSKEIRMEVLPKNLVSALEKECTFELKNYPCIKYTWAELDTIRDFVRLHLDTILSKLANTVTERRKMSVTQQIAEVHLKAGLSVLPVSKAEKHPVLPGWSEFQTHLPKEDQVGHWFASERDAICIVCGKVSGLPLKILYFLT